MLNLPSLRTSNPKRESIGPLRIMRDLSELNTLPSTCEVTQPDLSNVSQLTITISPDDGFYKGGRFIFSIVIPSDYPCKPPKIKCTQTIYHPNIDLNGNVCLNILREEWNPIFTIETVVLGLIFLFLQPNPDDPLNHEAATIFRTNLDTFKSNVNKTMAGGTLNNIEYNNMKKSKEAPVIVETTVGKFLLRDFRPPIQLRTSPRKTKTKLKKEIKRLDENTLSLLTNKKHFNKNRKKKLNKVKKQLNFDDQEEKNSVLFIISNDEQENQLNEDELTNNKCNLCFVNSKARRALIFSPRLSRITLLGLFSLEQISGPPASLHGFTLQSSKRYSIFNLSSQSLMSIETTSSSSKSSLHENQILSFFNDYHIQLPLPEIYIQFIQKLAKFHHGLSVFFVEQLQTTWIESMKQFSNSQLANQWLFNYNNNNDDEQTQNTDAFKQLWTGMGAFKDTFHRSINYTTEIHLTTDEIISRLSNKTTNDPLIVFVCGAKDCGKSTYLRYLINKCLSQTNILPKITFLDCDIGQSEFTPSGTISLINNLTEPLFGPSASHLKKALKSFYFGNIKVENDKIVNYLNYVKLSFDYIQNDQHDLLLVNTMGWGSDTGLIIMKELIDLIKPNILVQLRSSSPHFRHIMPDINPQWSINASKSDIYRQTNKIPLDSFYNEYDYNLLLTPVRQHNHGKSNLTRQACLWSYFCQLEPKQLIIKPLIDYIDHIQILSFEKIGIGLLHRQIEPKYLLQVLNGSIIALCKVKYDMLYHTSSSFPALIDERANVECLGFGFVRSIDMHRREIHVIIPDRSIPKTLINAIIKGHDDCPDEFYFISIDRWRGHMPPYVTGLINSTV